MKGVIVEIRSNFAAMLSDDGCVTKIKNNHYQIGQVVDLQMKTRFNVKKAVSIAAAACFIFAGSGTALAYYTPASYVSLDVNPSIEFTLNMFDRVLSAKGVNDDGTEIIEQIGLSNLSNKTIDEAIATTVENISNAGYFDSGEGGIVITTSARDLKQAAELADELEEVADETADEQDKDVEVSGEAIGAQRVEEARQLGVTPGKLNLVQKLIASSDDPASIDQTEWLNKSVKDIMAQIKANRKADKVLDPEEAQNEEQNQDQDEGQIPEQGEEPNVVPSPEVSETPLPTQTPVIVPGSGNGNGKGQGDEHRATPPKGSQNSNGKGNSGSTGNAVSDLVRKSGANNPGRGNER